MQIQIISVAACLWTKQNTKL